MSLDDSEVKYKIQSYFTEEWVRYTMYVNMGDSTWMIGSELVFPLEDILMKCGNAQEGPFEHAFVKIQQELMDIYWKSEDRIK